MQNAKSSKSFARKVGRLMWVAFSIFLLSILILVSLLLVWSYPGKPGPILDETGKPLAGSISEKRFIEINGVRQGMFIQGKDVNNPVLLYLHGGMPEYFLQEQYPTGLEDYFTVVWWEQRGSGISFSPKQARGSITSELMVSDTIALTNYLRGEFGKEKIYLMGHSGGSYIGIQAAARAPELFHAYIGVAQMSNQLKSERLAYEYMLQQYQSNGNTSMLQKLEAAPVTLDGGTPKAYLLLRDTAMHSLGIGTTYDMKSVLTGIFLPSLRSKNYTLPEKLNTWRGKASSGVASLWDEMLMTDLSEQVVELDIPVYFLCGIYDYTVNYTLSKEYFNKLSAPVKGFYTFEQSAHSPVFEEPEKVRKILLEDVLAGRSK